MLLVACSRTSTYTTSRPCFQGVSTPAPQLLPPSGTLSSPKCFRRQPLKGSQQNGHGTLPFHLCSLEPLSDDLELSSFGSRMVAVPACKVYRKRFVLNVAFAFGRAHADHALCIRGIIHATGSVLTAPSQCSLLPSLPLLWRTGRAPSPRTSLQLPTRGGEESARGVNFRGRAGGERSKGSGHVRVACTRRRPSSSPSPTAAMATSRPHAPRIPSPRHVLRVWQAGRGEGVAPRKEKNPDLARQALPAARAWRGTPRRPPAAGGGAPGPRNGACKRL